MTPGRSGTSASHRPSVSRSSSIVKVTSVLYYRAGWLTSGCTRRRPRGERADSEQGRAAAAGEPQPLDRQTEGSRMKSKSLVLVGAASYLLAWFLPVVEGGKSLSTGTLPGWEAFRVALSPIWPYDSFELSAWSWSLLYVVSGLTNFVLVGALLRVILNPSQPHRFLRAIVFASAAFNTWFLLLSDRGDLRMGYYVWAIAFFLIGAGVASGRPLRQGTPEAV
jgi:hypothetical protein